MAYIISDVKSKSEQYGLEHKDILKLEKTASQSGAFYRKTKAIMTKRDELEIESEESRDL